MQYTIGQISQRIGVPQVTIRSWERKYNWTIPKRSKSKYRIYSESDLRKLMWLQVKRTEGVRLSSAVNYWNDLSDEERQYELGLLSKLEVVTEQTEGDEKYSGHLIEDLQLGKLTFKRIANTWKQAAFEHDDTLAANYLLCANTQYPADWVFHEIITKQILEAEMNGEELPNALYSSALIWLNQQLSWNGLFNQKKKQIYLVARYSEYRARYIATSLKYMCSLNNMNATFYDVDQVISRVKNDGEDRSEPIVFVINTLKDCMNLHKAYHELNPLGVPLYCFGDLCVKSPLLARKLRILSLGDQFVDASSIIHDMVSLNIPASSSGKGLSESSQKLHAKLQSKRRQIHIDIYLETAKRQSLNLEMMENLADLFLIYLEVCVAYDSVGLVTELSSTLVQALADQPSQIVTKYLRIVFWAIYKTLGFNVGNYLSAIQRMLLDEGFPSIGSYVQLNSHQLETRAAVTL